MAKLWLLVTRAEDMPGSWLARVLDFGLTTQADSIDEAIKMAKDALRIAIVSDAEKGLDPFERKRAAPEHWAALEKLLSNPKRSRLGDLSPEQRSRITAVAAQIVVSAGAEGEWLEAQNYPVTSGRIQPEVPTVSFWFYIKFIDV